MRSVTLEIRGMKCGGCVSSVEKALEGVSGVRRADVSLDESRARLATEDDVSRDALIQAVEGAGFEATARD